MKTIKKPPVETRGCCIYANPYNLEINFCTTACSSTWNTVQNSFTVIPRIFLLIFNCSFTSLTMPAECV